MISLKARLERFHDGENAWEQYSLPVNSNLHLYLEHSLANTRLQLEAIVQNIQNACSEWKHSHEMGRLPTQRIVEIYGKCITAKRQISKLKTFPTKQREFDKLHKLLQQLAPYTVELRSSIGRLQNAIDLLKRTLEEDVKTLLAVPGVAELVFYRQWTVQCFVGFLHLLLDKFQWELERKNLIEIRIVNTMDRDELRTCRNLWQMLHQNKCYEDFWHHYLEFRKEISEVVPENENTVVRE